MCFYATHDACLHIDYMRIIVNTPFRAFRRVVFLRRLVVDGLPGLQARENLRNPLGIRREREIRVPGRRRSAE